jgi:hypothetical protein
MSRFFTALTLAFALSGMVQAGELEAQQQPLQAQDSITGTITGLGENAVTVRSDDQQSMTTVRVDRQTRILDERGQRVATRADDLLGNLGSGDRIVVTYRTVQEGQHVAVSIEMWNAERHQARGADQAQRQEQMRQEQMLREQQRQTPDSITGTITAMTGNSVTLRTDDQRSMTVRVDQETRLLDERGQRVMTRAGEMLGNLDSGDRVVVNYRSGEGTNDRIAASIERRSAAQAQRQDQRTQAELRQQDELPRTSSPLPLIAALGLIGLVGAGAVTVAVRR